MDKVLDQIINNIGQDNNQKEIDKTVSSVENSNPLTDNYLNNLDGIDETFGNTNIKVFGIGGAGCNVIKYMKFARTWDENVQIYAINTDITSLKKISGLSNRYLLGKNLLRGHGSGGDPLIGASAIDEDREEIKKILVGTDLLFLVAGLGKGTGSGATPEIAKIAKEMGILTVAVVNLPSIAAEGGLVYQNAIKNLNELKKYVTSITTISNDLIIKNSGDDISFIKAFEKANEQVTSTIGEIVDIINNATEMNIDFADLNSFFKDAPVFNSNKLILSGEYSLDGLRSAICRTLQNSYTDIKLDNAKKVIVNLKINNKTPSKIIGDICTIFKTLSKNNDLWIVSGVDYVNIEDIKISFLISAKDEASENNSIEEDVINFKDIYNSTTNNNEQQKNEVTNSLHAEKILSSGLEANTYQPSQKTYITKERYVFDENKIDDLQDEQTSNQLDSEECLTVISNAMTGVINATSLNKFKLEKSKNN